MVQLEEAAAVAEPEVVETELENSEVETTEETNETDVVSDYPDDEPAEPETDEADEIEGDDDEAAGEPEEAIAAPVSLKAEEKEQFSQLQPEAQQMLSEVLSRRDTETQQGLESARQAQREAEQSAADTVAQTQQEYAERFTAFAEAYAPQPPDERQFSDINQFLLAKERYRDARAQHDQVVEQIGGIKKQGETHFEQQDQSWKAEQFKQLMSIPEFADEKTRVEFLTSVDNFGVENGYTQEELAQAGAKDVLFIKRAMTDRKDAEQWRAHVKQRNTRPRKAGRFAKTAPAGGQAPAKANADPLKLQYPDD